MSRSEMKVVVICTGCGALAPHDPPDDSHPQGVWHWDKPCRCGANEWAAHDRDRDIRTGRPLQPVVD